MIRLVAVLLLFASLPAMGRETSFTTFNVRLYGMERQDAPDAATQDHLLKSKLREWGALGDVVAFQEIVDVERLKSHVMGDEHRCASYRHRIRNHLHVVICHKRNLVFEKADGDENYALEDVALGNIMLRPAVHGILKTSRGRPLAHVVALHLKASREHAETRIEQVKRLAAYLKDRGNDLPVVIMGDVNTYSEEPRRMGRVFRDAELSLRHLYARAPYTWRIPYRGRKFDRVWVSNTVDVTRYPKVVGPCNLGSEGRDEIRHYNALVSDHCPLTFKVDL